MSERSERLRPRDLAILAAESPTTPMHNATVEVFDPGTANIDPDAVASRKQASAPPLSTAPITFALLVFPNFPMMAFSSVTCAATYWWRP